MILLRKYWLKILLILIIQKKIISIPKLKKKIVESNKMICLDKNKFPVYEKNPDSIKKCVFTKECEYLIKLRTRENENPYCQETGICFSSCMFNRCISVEFVENVFLKKKILIINYFITIGILFIFFILVLIGYYVKSKQNLKRVNLILEDNKINFLIKDEFNENFEEDFDSKSLSSESYDSILTDPLDKYLKLNKSYSSN